MTADIGPVESFQVGYLGADLAHRPNPSPSLSERWLAYYISALSDAT